MLSRLTDVFGIILRFLEAFLGSGNLVCSAMARTKTTLHFTASFVKAHVIHFCRKARERYTPVGKFVSLLVYMLTANFKLLLSLKTVSVSGQSELRTATAFVTRSCFRVLCDNQQFVCSLKRLHLPFRIVHHCCCTVLLCSGEKLALFLPETI